ncbi:hypothetical protein niasHT_015613 [Heterodera trifolii]|uniref:Uncharacterized protein n=1 Tax=Heterodera trifolii TaxID=157864 RepID=A0ABD2LCF6_9BILA
MSNKTKEPLAFVTGVDDKCVFIWSSEYPLEELRFPVKLGAQRPELGQKVQYVCTKSPHEVQYGGILKRIENPSPIIIQRDGEFVVETYVAFPSPGSNYCLRELAMAEDYHIRFYCHSVEMGTVVSFRDWDYNWEKVYQVHLKRFPKHCDWMVPRVSTMWRICNMQEVTDSAKTAQISSQMPWNNSFDGDSFPMQSLSILDADQNLPNFLTQSTSQMAFSEDPLIKIEENNPRADTSTHKLPTNEKLLPQNNQFVSNVLKAQTERQQQQQYQIINFVDNNAPPHSELTSGFNDFADLLSNTKTNDVVPDFGMTQMRKIEPNHFSEPKILNNISQLNQTSVSQVSNNPTQFHELGMYVATLLSKTPQHRIGEAIRLKGQIFSMCTSKQIDLMSGNM